LKAEPGPPITIPQFGRTATSLSGDRRSLHTSRRLLIMVAPHGCVGNALISCPLVGNCHAVAACRIIPGAIRARVDYGVVGYGWQELHCSRESMSERHAHGWE